MRYQYTYENPFNVEAELISHLRTLDSELFYCQDQRKSLQLPADLEGELEALLQKLPTMRDGKKLLLSGVPPDEKLAVQQWEHYGEFLYMLWFIVRYTEKLRLDLILSSAYFFSITHSEDGTGKEFESLNDNVEGTRLLILPKIKTIHDPLDPSEEALEEDRTGGGQKHWATDRMPGIQDMLSHTFYVDVDMLAYQDHQYRVMHSILERHMFTENRKTLRIAVCPLAHKDLLQTKTYLGDGNQRLFCVEGLKCTDFVHDRIKAAFMRAGEQHADILIFPEMLADETVLSRGFFEETKEMLSSHGYPMPALILLPTWWHDHRNELYVLDAAGKRLCVQQKQIRYLFSEKETGELYAEALREPEAVIHMVHIPEVGRFAFPICRDFLESGYVQLLLQQLRSTFLICPSYSPNKTQFDLTAPGVIQYGCYTVWCNTCAAYYDSERLPGHIGLVAGPQEIPATMCLLSPQCGGNCEDEAQSCVFLVEISMDRSAVITCEHIYR